MIYYIEKRYVKNESRFEISKDAKIYPKLGIYTLKNVFDISSIRDFDVFCNEDDDRVSSGLLGYYHRFESEIFSE